jgi:predicted nucleic acid-binding protein
MSTYRVYMDTSTLGGYYDEEFAESTRLFFQMVFEGKIHALISDTLVTELLEAPVRVQELLEKVINHGCERLALTTETEELRDAYLSAGVVSSKYSDDALHVAHATLSRADVIVSWNFKHLVNPFRVKGFNTVNQEQGYGAIIIMTPSDIVKTMEDSDDEKQNI